jgi:hypothetical protein
MSSFVDVVNKYNYKISTKEMEILLDSYPGIDEGTKRRLNVSRLYDQKYNLVMKKMYHKVDVHEN